MLDALEDEGAVDEKSYDWDGMVAFVETLRVAEQAAEALGRFGADAVEPLFGAIERGGSACGARTYATFVLKEVTIDGWKGLSSTLRVKARGLLDTLRTSLENPQTCDAVREDIEWAEVELAEGGDRWLQLGRRLAHPGTDTLLATVEELRRCPDQRWVAALFVDFLLGSDLSPRAMDSAVQGLIEFGPILDEASFDRLLKSVVHHRPFIVLPKLLLALAAYGRRAQALEAPITAWLDPFPPQRVSDEHHRAIHQSAVTAARMLIESGVTLRPGLSEDYRPLMYQRERIASCVLPQLRQILRAGEPEAQVLVAWRLMKLESSAGAAIEELLSLLLEPPNDEYRRYVAVTIAIVCLSEAARPAVPRLIELLGYKRSVYLPAARTLGALGATAVDALPALEALAQREADAGYKPKGAPADPWAAIAQWSIDQIRYCIT